MNVAPPPARQPVSTARLVLTLGIAGALAGLLLVFVDQATREKIKENRRRALREAVAAVLGGPKRVVSLRVEGDRLVREEEPNYEVDTESLNRIFAGYEDEAGTHLVGLAVAYQRTGFQDVIRLIYGYDPRTKEILGVKILESKETPGLGDRIEKEPFLGPFEGKQLDLVGVKRGEGSGDVHEVDTITGATISSTWVITIINEANRKVQDAVKTWLGEGGR